MVLSGLLEKSFPGECWARRLVSQARNLQRQRHPEAALARCQQALDPGKWARAPVEPQARDGRPCFLQVVRRRAEAESTRGRLFQDLRGIAELSCEAKAVFSPYLRV